VLMCVKLALHSHWLDCKWLRPPTSLDFREAVVYVSKMAADVGSSRFLFLTLILAVGVHRVLLL
jgi:hypothetical protein